MLGYDVPYLVCEVWLTRLTIDTSFAAMYNVSH